MQSPSCRSVMDLIVLSEVIGGCTHTLSGQSVCLVADKKGGDDVVVTGPHWGGGGHRSTIPRNSDKIMCCFGVQKVESPSLQGRK